MAGAGLARGIKGEPFLVAHHRQIDAPNGDVGLSWEGDTWGLCANLYSVDL